MAGNRCHVDVRLITENGVERRKPDDIGSLIDGPGLVWIDVAYWDATTEEKLVALLGLHPRAAHDCTERNPVPKVHVYPGHVSWCCTAPSGARAATCTTSSSTSSSAPNWLVTVHGPMNPAVDPGRGHVETAASPAGWTSGRLRPDGRSSCPRRWSRC